MSAEDGFEDEHADFRPPPALDDRLWRHPAEIGHRAPTAPTAPSGPMRGTGPRPAPTRARRSPWALGFVSVIGSAVLAGSLMFTAGGIGDEPQRLGLQPLATLVSDPAGAGGVGIVGIDVEAAAGSRRGSGMVLDDGVHVVTSLQLVPASPAEGTVEPAVRVTDDHGVIHRGEVVARDAVNDLAIIRTDGAKLAPWVPPVTAPVAAGDPVDAIGGGFGVGLRTWSSVVRAVDEAVRGDHVDIVGVALLADPLPAAAAGAVALRPDGSFLGMISVDQSAADSSSIATFTAVIVPASRLLATTRQFASTGHISHGWLGVEAPAPVDTLRSVSLQAGATVADVVADSPAGHAGVQPGDVLLSVCGHDVDSIDDVLNHVLATPPGTRCPLVLLRAGERRLTDAIIGERAA